MKNSKLLTVEIFLQRLKGSQLKRIVKMTYNTGHSPKTQLELLRNMGPANLLKFFQFDFFIAQNLILSKNFYPFTEG